MPLLNITKTAQATGLSAYELRRGAKRGDYPCLKVGRKYMFDPDEILRVAREKMKTNQQEAAECSKT